MTVVPRLSWHDDRDAGYFSASIPASARLAPGASLRADCWPDGLDHWDCPRRSSERLSSLLSIPLSGHPPALPCAARTSPARSSRLPRPPRRGKVVFACTSAGRRSSVIGCQRSQTALIRRSREVGLAWDVAGGTIRPTSATQGQSLAPRDHPGAEDLAGGLEDGVAGSKKQ